MKKTIILFFGIIILFTNFNMSQNHVLLKKNPELDNQEIAKIIASKANFNHNHYFINFVKKYAEISIYYQIECGIPVSIQLAQAIVESGGGNSELGKKANNLFGMKYYKEIFSGDFYDAGSGGKWRKYSCFEESFADHADFLHTYYGHAVGKDWNYWVTKCKGYGAAGYWVHIGDAIKRYKLYEYDNLVETNIKKYKS